MEGTPSLRQTGTEDTSASSGMPALLQLDGQTQKPRLLHLGTGPGAPTPSLRRGSRGPASFTGNDKHKGHASLTTLYMGGTIINGLFCVHLLPRKVHRVDL